MPGVDVRLIALDRTILAPAAGALVVGVSGRGCPRPERRAALWAPDDAACEDVSALGPPALSAPRGAYLLEPLPAFWLDDRLVLPGERLTGRTDTNQARVQGRRKKVPDLRFLPEAAEWRKDSTLVEPPGDLGVTTPALVPLSHEA